ncbi:pilus assembly protein TadG-related protein [Microtetraspora niveoalba]|uniref:pilus assembly protein TadG-related protein n=1 Tax=Microtetraspora niveoalba TaxID=46175 RepID=UPI000AF2A6B9|nr:pilus assembly protein TadG-related protein [Microtetraspora niveoalba]
MSTRARSGADAIGRSGPRPGGTSVHAGTGPAVARGARGRGPGDRGSMSVFVVVFSVAVFLLAGLLVDGGAAMNARLRAADVAEQGARAAADQIDVEALRADGRVRLLSDEGVVCGRAREIVAAHDDRGVRMRRCEIGGGQAEVTVEVGVRWDAVFLSMLGFGGSEAAATATAGPDVGDAGDV